MSKAFKCDSCKVCFDPANIPDNRQFTTIKNLELQSEDDYLRCNVRWRNYEPMHLCPECTGKLKKMLGITDKEEKIQKYEKSITAANPFTVTLSDIANTSSPVYSGTIGRTDTSYADSTDPLAERAECSEEIGKR